MRERTLYPPLNYLQWWGLFCTDSETSYFQAVVSRVDNDHPHYPPTLTTASRLPATWEQIYQIYILEDPDYVEVNARRERRVAATQTASSA